MGPLMKFAVTVLHLVLLGVTTTSSVVVADNYIDSGGVPAAAAVADEDGVKQRRMKHSKKNKKPTPAPIASTPAPIDAPTEPLVDIPTTLVADGEFGTLVFALTETDLGGALSAPGPFTVFAPPDAAFAALPDGLVDCLLEQENLPILSNILLYHVASGQTLSTDLVNGMQISTLLSGESEDFKLTVDLTNDSVVKINEATVECPNVLASNGVIHVIDEVLIPPGIDVEAFLAVCRAPDIPNLMAVPQSGKATTTRYWDCQGGACGCGFGSGAKNTFCHSNALRKAPAGNKYGAQFYGSAAISDGMGGGDWQAPGCGKCWKLTATKNDDGSEASGTIVVKGTNHCPQDDAQWCGGTKKHFDIAAPGFDTPYGANHNCGELEPGEPALSPQVCANWPNQRTCDCGKLKSKVLQRGCEHFKSLNWDNAHVDFELVTCPAELTIACDPTGVWPKKSPPTCSK